MEQNRRGRRAQQSSIDPTRLPNTVDYVMLVWIASYPGSLDYLFLQVLHQRFGIPWYEAEIADQSSLPADQIATQLGQKSAKGSWRKFYERAVESDRLVLARTRMPPTDAIPFVYISREGSRAIRTFYNQNLQGKTQTSLSRTILGHHMYGDWTGHFQNWQSRSEQANGKFITIEQFISDPESLIDSVSPILGSPAVISAAQLEAVQHTDIAPNGDMLPDEAALFDLVHGESATARGYARQTSAIASISDALAPETLLSCIEEYRKSIRMIGQMHEMSGYITSLQSQLSEETGRLRDYIDVLKNENSRLKNGG